MSTNEQQAQRDKLIELYEAVLKAQIYYGDAIAKGTPGRIKLRSNDVDAAEKAFRDYVEHMHDSFGKCVEENKRFKEQLTAAGIAHD